MPKSPSLHLPKLSLHPETPMNRAFQPKCKRINDEKVFSL